MDIQHTEAAAAIRAVTPAVAQLQPLRLPLHLPREELRTPEQHMVAQNHRNFMRTLSAIYRGGRGFRKPATSKARC
jgi:hypothetical protein